MGRTTKFATVLFVFAALLFFSPVLSAQTGVTTHTGALADGATYLIEVPANWNGTLFLYSHGYVTPGAVFSFLPSSFFPHLYPPSLVFIGYNIF